MKFLTPRIHGYLDFVVVALFALAPTLFGFVGTPATLCYILAAVHLVLTLTTAFPLGILKLIPFTVHGALELVVSIFLVSAPFVLGFADQSSAKIFFIASGILVFLVYLVTDYKAAAADRASHARTA